MKKNLILSTLLIMGSGIGLLPNRNLERTNASVTNYYEITGNALNDFSYTYGLDYVGTYNGISYSQVMLNFGIDSSFNIFDSYYYLDYPFFVLPKIYTYDFEGTFAISNLGTQLSNFLYFEFNDNEIFIPFDYFYLENYNIGKIHNNILLPNVPYSNLNEALKYIVSVEGFIDFRVAFITQTQLANELLFDTFMITNNLEYFPKFTDQDLAYWDGYKDGKNDGMEIGYEKGKADGFNDGVAADFDSFSWLTAIFTSMGSLLSIQLLPNVSIGGIVILVMVLTLVPFLIGLLKGGKD